MKIRLLALILTIGFGHPVMADAPLRPHTRPDLSVIPVAALVFIPVVARAVVSPALLSRQETRADALTIVPLQSEPAPPELAPTVLLSLRQTSGPHFRPEGDFGSDAGATETPTLASLRPELRPELRPGLHPGPVPGALPVPSASVAAPPVLLALAAPMIRPHLRPGDMRADSATDAVLTVDDTPILNVALSVPAAPALSALAVAVAMVPQERSPAIMARADAARVARVRGSVCGNPQIQGEVLGDVAGAGACGVDGGVLVRSVNGVRLSTAATVDCATANALQDWVSRAAQPSIGDFGGGLVSLQIMGSYACRGRNNQSGARLSEHGFGRAVDIGGFGLKNGNSITVLNGWGTDSQGDRLRAMHRAACGIFGTVLGPEANAFHRDHFHFDTAQYRSGSYCE